MMVIKACMLPSFSVQVVSKVTDAFITWYATRTTLRQQHIHPGLTFERPRCTWKMEHHTCQVIVIFLGSFLDLCILLLSNSSLCDCDCFSKVTVAAAEAFRRHRHPWPRLARLLGAGRGQRPRPLRQRARTYDAFAC